MRTKTLSQARYIIKVDEQSGSSNGRVARISALIDDIENAAREGGVKNFFHARRDAKLLRNEVKQANLEEGVGDNGRATNERVIAAYGLQPGKRTRSTMKAARGFGISAAKVAVYAAAIPATVAPIAATSYMTSVFANDDHVASAQVANYLATALQTGSNPRLVSAATGYVRYGEYQAYYSFSNPAIVYDSRTRSLVYGSTLNNTPPSYLAASKEIIGQLETGAPTSVTGNTGRGMQINSPQAAGDYFNLLKSYDGMLRGLDNHGLGTAGSTNLKAVLTATVGEVVGGVGSVAAGSAVVYLTKKLNKLKRS